MRTTASRAAIFCRSAILGSNEIDVKPLPSQSVAADTEQPMKAVPHSLVLLTPLIVGCAHPHTAQPSASSTPRVNKQVSTEAQSVAVVVADMQRRGSDPSQEECSAKRIDGDWWVTAWHIWYPKNVGSSRFVPGGFTTYVVSTDGKIMRSCGDNDSVS